MLKTVKSKVIAGIVSVGLLAGGGAALANSDAGAQLKNWYDSQFGVSSSQVVSDSYGYASSLVPGLLTEYNGLKRDTTNKLVAKGEFVTDVTNNSIDKKSQAYIDQINQEKAHVETYLASQFKSLSDAANGLIQESGADALAYANGDLAKHAAAAGSKAIEELNINVKGATAEAAKRLQDAIDNAKNDLQAQLDINQAATTTEIKGMIDAKITELRTVITSTNNQLIAYQERSITMAAKSLLLAGQAELDGIVGNINK